jgi:hypothetical protein
MSKISQTVSISLRESLLNRHDSTGTVPAAMDAPQESQELCSLDIVYYVFGLWLGIRLWSIWSCDCIPRLLLRPGVDNICIVL